jgi:hypothetical protein
MLQLVPPRNCESPILRTFGYNGWQRKLTNSGKVYLAQLFPINVNTEWPITWGTVYGWACCRQWLNRYAEISTALQCSSIRYCHPVKRRRGKWWIELDNLHNSTFKLGNTELQWTKSNDKNLAIILPMFSVPTIHASWLCSSTSFSLRWGTVYCHKCVTVDPLHRLQFRVLNDLCVTHTTVWLQS